MGIPTSVAKRAAGIAQGVDIQPDQVEPLFQRRGRGKPLMT